jgi:peptide chain release factor 3
MTDSLVRTPLLGAVGVLQFDVLQYRLQTEYGAPSRVESAPWSIARWVKAKDSDTFVTPKPPKMQIPTGGTLVKDPHGAWVVLLSNAWSARYFQENNPDLEVVATPPALAVTAEKE